MHRLLVLALFISCPAWTATSIPQIACSECRDPYQYPRDYGNFAFNQAFGSEAWMSPELANHMIVKNPSTGHWAYVDLDYVLIDTGISINLGPISYSVPIPNGEINIKVQLPDSTSINYRAPVGTPYLKVGDAEIYPYPSPVSPQPSAPLEPVVPEIYVGDQLYDYYPVTSTSEWQGWSSNTTFYLQIAN